jgi:hypothetical protein
MGNFYDKAKLVGESLFAFPTAVRKTWDESHAELLNYYNSSNRHKYSFLQDYEAEEEITERFSWKTGVICFLGLANLAAGGELSYYEFSRGNLLGGLLSLTPAATNLASLGYEIYRGARGKPKENKRSLEKITANTKKKKQDQIGLTRFGIH